MTGSQALDLEKLKNFATHNDSLTENVLQDMTQNMSLQTEDQYIERFNLVGDVSDMSEQGMAAMSHRSRGVITNQSVSDEASLFKAIVKSSSKQAETLIELL